MSTELQAKPQIQPWVQPYLDQVSKKLSPSIRLNEQGGVVIADTATDAEISKAIESLTDIKVKSQRITAMIDRFIGQLILHYSAIHNADWTTSISQLGLCETTGRTYKGLLKLPRIVQELPDEAFTLPGICTNHLDAATSFATPKDPDLRLKFNERRMEILRKVSQDPTEFNRGWVLSAMRELQREFGISPSRRPSNDQIKMNLILSFLMLIDFTDDEYKMFGVSKEETLDRLKKYREEGIEYGVIPESMTDPLVFCPPWKVRSKTPEPAAIDVEQIENEHTETTEVPADQEVAGEADGHAETVLQGQGAAGIHVPAERAEDGGEAGAETGGAVEQDQLAREEGDRVLGEGEGGY